MTKNAKIITLVVVMLVALIASIVMVSVYATTHDDQVSSNGFTVKKTGNTCVITGYNGKDSTVKIPHKVAGKKVVGVEPTVFKGKDIKNIEFDGTFEGLELSDYVFSEMNKLEYVKLPEGLKKIPTGAFRNSSALTHVTLPSSLESIGEFAFQGCSNLVYTTDEANDSIVEQKDKKFYLSSNIIRLEKAAFEGCRALTKVVINDKLEYIGVSAFQNAQNLLNLTVSNNSLVSVVDDYAFNQTKLKSTNKEEEKLKFPNLKTIGKGAFGNITSYFEYFELGKGIEEIRDQAFLGTTALTAVVYDEEFNPKTFGNGVFTNCVNLRRFTSKSAYEKVEKNAMPKNMKKIPELTFSGCINLLATESFFIHKDIEEIGAGALAIYNYQGNPSRQMYTSSIVEVAEENDHFRMVELEKFNVGSSSTGSHYVLTTFDEKELIAYFGTYTTYATSGDKYTDAYRKTDFYGNSITSPEDKRAYSAFTFLHQHKDLRNNLEIIRSYAFAGVRFDRIFIPNSVVKICNKAFFNSDINVVLFNKQDCEFEKDTFAGMPRDKKSEDGNWLTIGLTDMSTDGTIKTQVNQFIEDGLVADITQMTLFA